MATFPPHDYVRFGCLLSEDDVQPKSVVCWTRKRESHTEMGCDNT